MDAKHTVEHPVEQVSSVAPIVAPKLAARSVGPGGGQHSAPAAPSGIGAGTSPSQSEAGSSMIASPYPQAKVSGPSSEFSNVGLRGPNPEGCIGQAPAKTGEDFARSPWLPVASRAAAILAGMLALAGIGVASTLAGTGVRVALPSAGAAPSTSGVWIAPDAPASAVSAPSKQTAAPSTPATAQSNESPDDHTSPEPRTGAGLTTDGKVILNLATAEELTKLPRVGAKRAQAILELRRRLGRFQRPTDLLRVRGIGRKTLKLMLPLLVVDAPATDTVR